jgi:hypothetical protein
VSFQDLTGPPPRRGGGATGAIDSSALGDLYVFALGHEVAAIKLSGHAADRCGEPTGRLLLTDLTLMRLDELRAFPGHRPASAGLAQSELCRLFGPGRSLEPRTVLPHLGGLRAPEDLIAAVIRFDQQGLKMLAGLGPLLPTAPLRALASQLREAKSRWLQLYADIRDSMNEPSFPWSAS